MMINSMKTIFNLIVLGIFSIPASVVAADCAPANAKVGASLANLVRPPVITGHNEADARIRLLAESRGYRSQAILANPDELVFPWSIHQCVLESWQAMRSAALEQGYALSIVSGYRSVTRQRQIFLSKLDLYEATIEAIVDGSLDQSIHEILEFNSIPGYSRHHSGFTIDIQSDGTGLSDFGHTAAYRWLAADGFRMAREFGFLPSYPEELPGQGPVPEPWEFIWVGETARLDGTEAATLVGNQLIEAAQRILLALDQAETNRPLVGTSSTPASVLSVGDDLPGG
jgi:LAS superfamily LD-carboxypeptidase LdcB